MPAVGLGQHFLKEPLVLADRFRVVEQCVAGLRDPSAHVLAVIAVGRHLNGVADVLRPNAQSGPRCPFSALPVLGAKRTGDPRWSPGFSRKCRLKAELQLEGLRDAAHEGLSRHRHQRQIMGKDANPSRA